MLRYLFNPPPEMSQQKYVRYAVAVVTSVSVGLSMLLTLLVESLTEEPQYLYGLSIAFLVPVLVAPLMAYWHAKVLFELKASKRKIEKLSRTDWLTDLYNRRYFFESAGESLALAKRHAYPVSLLMIDLDHFKEVNDQLGHQAGDEVLRRIACYIKEAMRSTDLLARYGGEEFSVLMPHTGAEDAKALCQRLRNILAERQAEEAGQLPSVTMSVGIASTDYQGYNLGSLVREADRALYQAKENGRNQCMQSESGS